MCRAAGRCAFLTGKSESRWRGAARDGRRARYNDSAYPAGIRHTLTQQEQSAVLIGLSSMGSALQGYTGAAY